MSVCVVKLLYAYLHLSVYVLLTLVIRFSLWLGSSVKSASNCNDTQTHICKASDTSAVHVVADSQCYITAAQKQHQTKSNHAALMY
jgi:hypothetical protein